MQLLNRIKLVFKAHFSHRQDIFLKTQYLNITNPCFHVKMRYIAKKPLNQDCEICGVIFFQQLQSDLRQKAPYANFLHSDDSG